MNEYEIDVDRISGSLQLLVEGENASVQPSDLICQALSPTLVVCAGGGDYTVIESWALFPDDNRVIYTQTRTEFPIPQMDGSKLFVGNLTSCD